MPMRKFTKWQMLLSEFDIVYVTQKIVKWQALLFYLAENLIDDEYNPLQTYLPDKEILFVGENIVLDKKILFVGEDIAKTYSRWRLFFDGEVNFKGSGIEEALVSEIGKDYPKTAKLCFLYTNNMDEYEACILGLKLALDVGVRELLVIGDSDFMIHQVRGEWVVKNSKITPYVELVQYLCGRFKEVDLRHIPRI